MIFFTQRHNATTMRQHSSDEWADQPLSNTLSMKQLLFSFALLLFAADLPFGLIVSDRGGGRPLDELGYNRFKQLCLLGAQGLASLAVKSASTSTR